MPITDEALLSLEREVVAALDAGDVAGLTVLGHGEISLVVGWPTDAPTWACKRLPAFGSIAAARAYEALLHRYVEKLEARGVRVLDTDVRRVASPTGGVAVYCVQPALRSGTLATEVVRTDGARATTVLEEIVDHIVGVVDDRTGLDAQLSNWATDDHGLTYHDVTTPMLRTAEGRSELDTGIFLASLPWALRRPVRRLVVPGVLDRYHDPRTVVLDLAANLIKERLEGHIATVIELAGDRVEPRLSEQEVRDDYRSDARIWAVLQRARRLDRAWQRHVRRRTYPFVLPEPIER